MNAFRSIYQQSLADKCRVWLEQFAIDADTSQQVLHAASLYLDELFPVTLPCPDVDLDSTPEEDARWRSAQEPSYCLKERVLCSYGKSSIHLERPYFDIGQQMESDISMMVAEDRGPESSRQAMLDELHDMMLTMRSSGLEEADIIAIVEQVFAPKITPLHVTRDYRLTLPALDNAEFNLGPAEKAFYLTFLSYPEGIRFSELIDYREEMLEYYSHISRRHDAAAAAKVINRLTEQGGNASSIAVSRINHEVRRHCMGNLSQFYGIYGPQGDVKRIALPSDMVCWE